MKEIGDRGESIAKNYLKKLHYKILESNYRVHRVGEIDLIAMDGETLVFVEVKYRKNTDFGRPEEYVDQRKREKLIRTANAYLACRNASAPVRFDVVAVTGPLSHPSVTLIPNAFTAE